MNMRSGMVVGVTVALSLGFLGPVPSAHAATIVVNSTGDDDPTGPNDGDCTLREALDAANSDTAEDACPAGTGTDLIVLPAGLYTLSVPGVSEDAGNTGDLDIFTTLTIRGSGPRTTTIDAGGIERAFHTPFQASPPPVEISGITMRGGNVPTTGGGAIFNQGALLTLRHVHLTGNVSEYGGGIADDDPATLTVSDSLVSGNIASDTDVGGGIDLDGIVSSFTNVTVSGNRAQDGGGLWINGGASTLNNVTVTGNTATNSGFGGGIQAFGATVTMRNSILAGNGLIEGSQDPDCDGTITSQGHNIIGNDSGCTFVSASGDQVGTAASPADPKLGPLADNGGPTQTHALLAGSPAIDAGDPAPPGSGGTACAATDQRGAPRNCDIGAYELVFCQSVVVNRVGTAGNDGLTGTTAGDGFLALGGNDSVTGLGGNDAVCSGTGQDRAAGGSGKDVLLGNQGKDTLKGGSGRDKLKGGPGRDVCRGGTGRDRATKCEITKKIP